MTALAKAKSGSTLVLRGGTYRESARVPFKKKLVIQSYPGEAVWLDGSVPVTGWQKSGATWFVSGWNHNFDSRVSYSSSNDQSDWFVDPKFPMAGHPDQVWIGGQRLAEVGSAAAVKPGTFFVDTAAKRLVVGSDPTGKQVQASVLQKALQIQGEGTIVRGIGVRRYATTLHMMGAVTTEVDDISMENVVITENATIGLGGWNARQRFRKLTITGNGLMGFGYSGAPGLVLEQSIISGNNVEHFNPAPVAGGVKITRTTGVTVRANLVENNINSSGIWLDESVKNATVVGNTVRGNDSTGISAEISDQIVIADNHVIANRGTGIWSYTSSNVDIWNNTLVANSRTLAVWQDDRDTSTAHYRNGLPWLSKNINIHNNVFSYGTNFCPVLTQDLRQKWTGNDFGITMNGNAYHRPSPKNPERFACWANGKKGTESFPTLTAFRNATGQ
ncbi:right-handed parallel beta-helix repeat-containing protein, partial [Aeromicrobium duanguangcaii]|uniref:right-handed parallel beta-helix repeat-containing protein n=1 Tax=Aeromicrobium duanguangcaii TaxID=2968086 RepID=UPI002016C2AC|nr:right-handed parallel beta-helix repeat-containing protein [Aeromicrobium duanguangcaii]